MNEELQKEIDENVCRLYGLLLRKDHSQMTETEASIMYYCVFHEAVQRRLKEEFGK